jgi:hypothetical protein
MPNRPKRKKDMSEENNAEQSEVRAPDINIGDFNAILQIIDVASTRGAFRGEELTSVGTVRDRVSAFVSFYTHQRKKLKAMMTHLKQLLKAQKRLRKLLSS